MVSSSDIPLKNGDAARPLSEKEIKKYLSAYAKAAKTFVELAGGDGVESKLILNRFIKKA